MTRVAVFTQQTLTCAVYTGRKRADGLFHFFKDDGINAVRKVGYDGLLEVVN